MNIAKAIPFLKAMLPDFSQMTLKEKSSMIFNLVKVFTKWFIGKKDLIPLLPNESSLLLFFDVDPTEILRMAPSTVYNGRTEKFIRAHAMCQVALSNHAKHIEGTDPARAHEIREAVEEINYVLNLVANDQLINRMLVDHGLNATNMSQCIPATDFIEPFMKMVPTDENAVISPEQQLEVSNMIIDILRQAAAFPTSRLVYTPATYSERLADIATNPTPQVAAIVDETSVTEAPAEIAAAPSDVVLEKASEPEVSETPTPNSDLPKEDLGMVSEPEVVELPGEHFGNIIPND